MFGICALFSVIAIWDIILLLSCSHVDCREGSKCRLSILYKMLMKALHKMLTKNLQIVGPVQSSLMD